MKKIIFIAVCVLIRFALNTQECRWNVSKPVAELKNSIEVVATMYYAEASQCDADPLVTADGSIIKPNIASKLRWVALSRNLLKRWGGVYQYGDLIQIEGTDGKDGIYQVHDCMNKRFKNKIDILETVGTPQYKFDKVVLKKVFTSV